MIKNIGAKYAETWSELKDCFGHDIIYTTQMGALGWDWLAEGYLVTIVDSTGTYKLHLGADNERYSGELRKEHDLFKMWTKGVFSLNKE